MHVLEVSLELLIRSLLIKRALRPWEGNVCAHMHSRAQNYCRFLQVLTLTLTLTLTNKVSGGGRNIIPLSFLGLGLRW